MNLLIKSQWVRSRKRRISLALREGMVGGVPTVVPSNLQRIFGGGGRPLAAFGAIVLPEKARSNAQ